MHQKINMVDLFGQYEKIKTEIDNAINEVISSTAFIKGPKVREFESALMEYTGSKNAVSCGNGTDALQIALMALDLEENSEVITTPFTFIATIEVIKLLKLKPVLVDIDPKTFNIDSEKVRDAIGPKTKAIIPVHLFGQSADMDVLLNIAEENNIAIIEDAAQAIGTDYFFEDGTVKKAGTMGLIGTTSFFPSKNLGAYGDGGAIFTDDIDLSQKIRAIANHGMNRKYYYDYIGINSRLDSIQAAILNIKLKYLDNYNKARKEAADFYDSKFSSIDSIDIPFRSKSSSHIFHQYTLKVKNNRDELQQQLKNKGIPSMIYYPLGLHMQDAYKDLGYKEGDFPVTESLCKQVLSLPMHTELDSDQLEYITSSVIEILN